MRRTVFCTVGTSLKGSWERKYPGQQSGTDEWIQLLREDEKCCAEKASLELLALDPPQEHLAFLSSDTEDGSQCAAALASYYQERGIPDSTVFRVPGLRGNFNEFQGSGLPNLIQKMASVYQQYPGMRFIINATGGYKAQTAYATLFGILMGIEVVYLHEDFR
ncbi:MAG: putative CRISPR-associated protein, partial [bacterium]